MAGGEVAAAVNYSSSGCRGIRPGLTPMLAADDGRFCEYVSGHRKRNGVVLVCKAADIRSE